MEKREQKGGGKKTLKAGREKLRKKRILMSLKVKSGEKRKKREKKRKGLVEV